MFEIGDDVYYIHETGQGNEIRFGSIVGVTIMKIAPTNESKIYYKIHDDYSGCCLNEDTYYCYVFSTFAGAVDHLKKINKQNGNNEDDEIEKNIPAPRFEHIGVIMSQ